MEFLCKIDRLEGVYFEKPRMVAYYEMNYGQLEEAKKIFYFKEPKLQTYPINLNNGYDTYIRRQNISKSAIDCTLKYVMSSEFKRNSENVKKIKIFTRGGNLAELMHCYYRKKFTDSTIRVSRYNGDLYIGRHVYYNPKFKPVLTHHEQFLKNVFTETLDEEPNTNEPSDVNKALIGVFQCSFGEFELIYSNHIYGIQAENEFNDFNDLEALNTCHWVTAKQIWCVMKYDAVNYLKYWLQGYLTNVTDIYFAYKNSNGIIDEPIVRKRLSDLPKEYESHWQPNICLEFLYTFLQKVIHGNVSE
ncbi:hypothetical protein DOY81_006665 [Sarcophaga bullata]|nr:hypothetical protein DOY81_006665 [Sarcophaga bullata]